MTDSEFRTVAPPPERSTYGMRQSVQLFASGEGIDQQNFTFVSPSFSPPPSDRETDSTKLSFAQRTTRNGRVNRFLQKDPAFINRLSRKYPKFVPSILSFRFVDMHLSTQ